MIGHLSAEQARRCDVIPPASTPSIIDAVRTGFDNAKDLLRRPIRSGEYKTWQAMEDLRYFSAVLSDPDSSIQPLAISSADGMLHFSLQSTAQLHSSDRQVTLSLDPTTDNTIILKLLDNNLTNLVCSLSFSVSDSGLLTARHVGSISSVWRKYYDISSKKIFSRLSKDNQKKYQQDANGVLGSVHRLTTQLTKTLFQTGRYNSPEGKAATHLNQLTYAALHGSPVRNISVPISGSLPKNSLISPRVSHTREAYLPGASTSQPDHPVQEYVPLPPPILPPVPQDISHASLEIPLEMSPVQPLLRPHQINVLDRLYHERWNTEDIMEPADISAHKGIDATIMVGKPGERTQYLVRQNTTTFLAEGDYGLIPRYINNKLQLIDPATQSPVEDTHFVASTNKALGEHGVWLNEIGDWMNDEARKREKRMQLPQFKQKDNQDTSPQQDVDEGATAPVLAYAYALPSAGVLLREEQNKIPAPPFMSVSPDESQLSPLFTVPVLTPTWVEEAIQRARTPSPIEPALFLSKQANPFRMNEIDRVLQKRATEPDLPVYRTRRKDERLTGEDLVDPFMLRTGFHQYAAGDQLLISAMNYSRPYVPNPNIPFEEIERRSQVIRPLSNKQQVSLV